MYVNFCNNILFLLKFMRKNADIYIVIKLLVKREKLRSLTMDIKNIGFGKLIKPSISINSPKNTSDNLKQVGSNFAANSHETVDTYNGNNVSTNSTKYGYSDSVLLKETEINGLLKEFELQVAKDFIGEYSKYTKSVLDDLKFVAAEYFKKHPQASIDDIKNAVTNVYNQLKLNYGIKNTTDNEKLNSTSVSKVLDEIFKSITTELSEKYPDSVELIATEICQNLEEAAYNFTYKNQNSATYGDLKNYLLNIINGSDATKMEEAAQEFIEAADGLGYIQQNELLTMKNLAANFLLKLIQANIPFELNGNTISNYNQLSVALNKYEQGNILKNDIKNIIQSLSTETLKESILSKYTSVENSDANKDSTELSPEDLSIDLSEFELSDNYNSNKKIVSFLYKDRTIENAVKTITDELKDQIKAKYEKILTEKGLPTDYLDNIFEGVFTSSALKAAQESVYGFLLPRVKTQELLNKFVTIFNENIKEAISELNNSQKEMDISDINLEEALTENGKLDGYKKYLLQSGESIITINAKTDAEGMINRLHAVMIMKAMSMCSANGLEFNLTNFTSEFNNAKKYAIDSATSVITLNIKDLLNTFTKTFKENYTAMVQKEVSKM